MSEVFLNEGRKIIVAGEELVVKQLVLRTRTKVIRILGDAILQVQQANQGLTKEQLMKDPEALAGVFGILIEGAGEKLVEVYEIVTGKDREWLKDHVTLKDEVAIITAIWEDNDIPFLYRQVKGFVKSLQIQKATS